MTDEETCAGRGVSIPFIEIRGWTDVSGAWIRCVSEWVRPDRCPTYLRQVGEGREPATYLAAKLLAVEQGADLQELEGEYERISSALHRQPAYGNWKAGCLACVIAIAREEPGVGWFSRAERHMRVSLPLFDKYEAMLKVQAANDLGVVKGRRALHQLRLLGSSRDRAGEFFEVINLLEDAYHFFRQSLAMKLLGPGEALGVSDVASGVHNVGLSYFFLAAVSGQVVFARAAVWLFGQLARAARSSDELLREFQPSVLEEDERRAQLLAEDLSVAAKGEGLPGASASSLPEDLLLQCAVNSLFTDPFRVDYHFIGVQVGQWIEREGGDVDRGPPQPRYEAELGEKFRNATRAELVAEIARLMEIVRVGEGESEDLSSASLDELVAALETDSSTPPPGLVERLTALVREAQARPPKDRGKFRDGVNFILAASYRRFLLADGSLARMRLTKGGAFQFAVSGGHHQSFQQDFQIVPIRMWGRRLEPVDPGP